MRLNASYYLRKYCKYVFYYEINDEEFQYNFFDFIQWYQKAPEKHQAFFIKLFIYIDNLGSK